ncbi:hypothetical protein ACTMTF_32335 [Nonomuraea sp. ZG12]|uniref:hypothetical protein n=1 Tax=Nonomuraea sp. ZG12 TaxID=3452207 RepID=UPI003F8C85BA
MVDDISHEGLRPYSARRASPFQHLKTWKTSRDPGYAAKKARVEHLYAIADGEVVPQEGEPGVVFCGIRSPHSTWPGTSSTATSSRSRSDPVPEFCRYLHSLYPPQTRIASVGDNFSPHLTTPRCQRDGTSAATNNVEIAYTPSNSSWLNRIEAQFTAQRYFALDGTDHADHKEQGSMIRRYIIWRNRHAQSERLREVVARANVA